MHPWLGCQAKKEAVKNLLFTGTLTRPKDYMHQKRLSVGQLQGASARRAGVSDLQKSSGGPPDVSLLIRRHRSPIYKALGGFLVACVNSAQGAGGSGEPRLSYAGMRFIFPRWGWSGQTVGNTVNLNSSSEISIFCLLLTHFLLVHNDSINVPMGGNGNTNVPVRELVQV